MRTIGVSTDWPIDRFLYVQGAHFEPVPSPEATPDPRAFRSFDGGKTWEPLTLPPTDLKQVIIMPSTRLGRILFAATRSVFAGKYYVEGVWMLPPDAQPRPATGP